MKLEGNYYTLLGEERQGEGTVTFRISLLPECDIYRGHFPGNPVCPGVCNMQTIKECAEKVTGKQLRVSSVRQCRLKAVATPAICSELEVKVSVEQQPGDDARYTVVASISDAKCVYMDYKGEMTV